MGQSFNSNPLYSSLPFGNKRAYIHSDINAFTDYIGSSIATVLDYAPITHKNEFIYMSSSVDISGLKIAASVSSPSLYQVKESTGLYLFVPFSGWSKVSSHGIKGLCEAGVSAYFSPEIDRSGSTSDLSMIQLSMDHTRLLSTARGMLEDREFIDFKRSINDPRILALSVGAVQYSKIFGYLCKMIDDSELNTETLKFIGIDDIFYRTLVLMMSNKVELNDELAVKDMYSPTVADNIAEYISAHYQEPITMTIIESIAGTPIRNVYRSFKKRYQCSPMEWLYRYRLDMLRLRLEHARNTDSVTSLALECGFTRLGALSKLYADTFGEKPSATLRRSRRH
jgi:AraC-like DNA-binding protein